MAEKAMMCPHCQGHHLPTAELPREVVIVVPCPGCQELAVLFRDKVVPVDRSLMQSGTRRQRILHIAEIIMEFVDSGVVPEANAILLGENLPIFMPEPEVDADADDCDADAEMDGSGCDECAASPISDAEFEQFQKVDLRAIDNAAAFRRIFG